MEESFEIARNEQYSAEEKLDQYKHLVLTPEQEYEKAKETKTLPLYEYSLKDKKGNQVIIEGFKHTTSLEEYTVIREGFIKENPDVLFVEGEGANIARRVINEYPNLTDEDVIKKYGEQCYIAWLALKNGKTVESWDISYLEKLKQSLSDHGQDAFLGYLIGIASQSMGEGEQKISAEQFIKGIAQVCGLNPEEIVKELESVGKVDFSEDNLNRIARKYSKEKFGEEKTLTELTSQDGQQLSDPALPGETNNVLRASNIRRDAQAIEKIYNAKKIYKKVFVTAGANHTIAWQPALEAIYSAS